MKLLIHLDEPDRVRDVVAPRHPDVALAECRDYASMAEVIARERPDIVYTVRFAGPPNYPRAALMSAPSLKWIAVGGSGIDHLVPWDMAKLTVTNSAGVAAEAMAQYIIGGILHFTLDVPGFARRQRERAWDLAGKIETVTGRTLAILGLGHTGQSAARMAKGLGMQVVGIRARLAPTPHVDRVEPMERLHAVLARADYVAVCLPKTPDTIGLLDAAAFQALKPGAILADVSRGGIVRQAALLDALRSGRVKGAVLDVFETEPLPQDNPLWDLENVIVTPHCSSVYDGWERRSVEMFCDNLDRWKRGEKLQNVVDPARGY
ncbi:MAG TPA: D-2-hydroxyacid dehydrogenase [Dongiaceae bacterium]|nr:D-2-hydroxyacid dehydrogenase [Dongiaceae bacterium]